MCSEFEEITIPDKEIEGNHLICFKYVKIMEKIKKFKIKNKIKVPEHLMLKFFDNLRKYYDEIGYFDEKYKTINKLGVNNGI
jgi:hypothetical protein